MPRSGHSDDPRIVSFDVARASTLVASPGRGSGWWSGAPSVCRVREGVLLTYRLRAPRPRRGYALRIAWCDGARVDDVAEIRAAELAALSLERAALVSDGRALRLYVSYVDARDRTWRIDAIDATRPDAFDVRARRRVLDAASTGTAGVKDPVVVREGGRWRMYASYTPSHAGADHSGADVFATGAAPSCTGTATSGDGLSWHWDGPAFVPSGHGWDAYERRISCLIDERHALYDGIASAEDNYEERTGVARRDRDGAWRSLTRDAPLIDARYVAFDGERFYCERRTPDGAHELAVAPADARRDVATVR